MWLFTKYGFFSIVAAKKIVIRKGKPVKTQQLDPNKVMVRARSEEHLVALCKRFKLPLEWIAVTANTDYRYRILLTVKKWLWVSGALAEEATEVRNFKACVEDESPLPPEEKSDYLDALHEVWHTMFDLQAANISNKSIYNDKDF